MAKIGEFFGILLAVISLVGVAEAKTVSKTVTETVGVVAGGGKSLGECYYAQTSVSGRNSETVDQTKLVTSHTHASVSLVLYYTCGGGGGFKNVFEITGNDNLKTGDLVVADDRRTAWLKKSMLVEKDGYWYSIEVDIAIIADGEPFFSDNKNKSWSGSKAFQQTTQTKSQYHSGQVFGAVTVSGFNYLDNGFGYVFSEHSSSVVTNK